MSVNRLGGSPRPQYTNSTGGEIRYPKLTSVDSGKGHAATATRPQNHGLAGGSNPGQHLGAIKKLVEALTQLLQSIMQLFGGGQPGQTGAPEMKPPTAAPGGAPSAPGGTTGGMPDLTGGVPGNTGVAPTAPGGTRPGETPFISQYNPSGAGAGYTNGAANCAPASMAMIARSMGLGEGLTDAQLINKLGAAGGTDADGTSINGVVAMANELGVNAEIHGPRADADWIAQTLASGKKIVANGDYYAAPGHYQAGKSSGHYIEVDSMNADGTVNVRDPADPNLKTMTMQELATFINANKINGGYCVAIG